MHAMVGEKRIMAILNGYRSGDKAKQDARIGVANESGWASINPSKLLLNHNKTMNRRDSQRSAD